VIRDATVEDIPQMVTWGRQFADMTPWAGPCPFDAGDFANTLRGLIENGICLVSDKGMAAAVLAPCLFNHDAVVAQDLFVWRDGRLLAALEARARERGAVAFMMAAQMYAGMRPRAMRRWLRMHGYAQLETYWMKEL